MVVDPAGSVHAVIGDSRGLIYLTNASGTWTRERFGILLDGGAKDGDPSIAIDESGSLAVAFARSRCSPMACYGSEVFVVRYLSGVLEVPEGIGPGRSPQLAIRDGVLHLAYVEVADSDDEACGEPSPIVYATDETGQWIKSIAVSSSEDFVLALAADGTPLIAANDECGLLGNIGINLATLASEGFTLEPVPGTKTNYDYLDDLTTDAAGRSHVLYGKYDAAQEDDQSFISTRDASGWIEPFEPVENQSPSQVAAAPDGTIHIASIGIDGVWHSSNASGSFAPDLVSSMTNHGAVPLSLAVDVDGRPHILFGMGDGDYRPRELWYGVGPAN